METLNLTYGAHNTPEDGMCLMEAVAFLGGEEHSDQPKCACPVIARFGRVINDKMGVGPEGDALRAKYLAPLASRLVGTRSTPGVEAKRAYFFAGKAVRLFAPMAQESAGLKAEAERLRGIPEIVGGETARTAATAASAAATAAWSVSWSAATAAARAADAADAAAYAAYAASAASAATWSAEAAADAAEASADAAFTAAWSAAAAAAATAAAWEQVARVLVEACGITEGGA